MKIALLCGVSIVVSVHLAAAQTHRWEVEVHAGGVTANHPDQGDARLPEPGASFSTGLGTSRRVSSWYFGAGAQLLNDVIRSVARGPVVAPLDPVLNSASFNRRNGAIFGISVTRALTDRLSVEGTVDYGPGALRLMNRTTEALEATRASFSSAIGQFLVTPFAGSPISSTLALREHAGGHIVTSGALNVRLTTGNRFVPYGVIGGGMLSNLGNLPTADLTGNYQFRREGITFINETDTVNVRFSVSDRVAVFVIGGGVRWMLPSNCVLRVDARGQFSRNTLQILLDAAPSSTATPNASAFLTAGTASSIRFSSAAGTVTSLSGPAVDDFVTFDGRGLEKQFRITTGIGWRF